MKALRVLFAVVLILHGLAHASAGMWATDIGGRTLVTVLWEGATVGFIAAGAGLLGVAGLRRWWRMLVAVAAVSSLTLLVLYSHPLFIVGMIADFVLVALALAPAAGGQLTRIAPVRPWIRITLVTFMLYVAASIGFRPWHSSWGSTRSEQQMVMVGDPPIGESHYRIDHAVTIRAPVDSVWPWLVQIGQDRAGFYSYDWLERAFGASIRNADTIVPEWQNTKEGDLIRAVQPNYLGGLLGRDLGWRVRQIVPGRAMVLENWGAFVLEPLDSRSTRMHIRTSGAGVPTLSGIAITPLALLVLEPAHFIMERGMMLGLKRRAEQRVGL